jgi:hypothetical protein
MYRYTFVASRDEWLAAQRASSRGDRQVRNLRLMMAGLFAVVTVLTLAGSRDLVSGLRSQGLNLVLLGTGFAATGVLARFSTRLAMLVNPNIVGEKTVELNDTGVRWIGVGSTSRPTGPRFGRRMRRKPISSSGRRPSRGSSCPNA